ncbi:MAG: lipopolysaccharide core heptose(I) kinase RfaP [Desulfobacterales bacterium]|nr:lipopolysaccharide core heptose(I) kinase RfaP [Desulfobacterales bacterium]
MTLFLSPPFDRLWSGKDPFAAVERLEGEVFRSIEGRRTIRTEIDGRGFYVKIHRGIGWREIVKNFFFMRLPVLGAGNEWRAIRRLECLGVPTMIPVAYGCRGCNPAKQHSFIITEDLSPVISLEDFTRNWAKTPPASAVKRDLINEVARISRIMHAGGVNHRDFYLCHFMLRVTGSFKPGRLPLELIRISTSPGVKRVPRRWWYTTICWFYFFGRDWLPEPARSAAVPSVLL